LEPIGGHGGLVHYDVALCDALARLSDYQVIWVTCDETTLSPDGVRLWTPLGNLYGERPKWQRGLTYVSGLHKVLQDFRRRGGRAVLHQHFPTVLPADYWFVDRFRRFGGQVVITAHDVVPFDAGRFSHFWLKRLYSVADHIIVHAHQNKNELMTRYQYPASKASVIPQGNYAHLAQETARHTTNEARHLLGLDRFQKLILFFGTIKSVKGLDVLLKAMPKIAQKHPDVGLVIAGRVWKDDLTVYERITSDLHLQEFVEARIRYIPDDEVPLYFQAASTVVLPYRKVYNSAVLFTAMSYSRPIVATACGGMTEVIEDGVTGYLVPPGDPAALAERVNAVLSDPATAAQMAGRAYHHIVENYSWDSTARATLDVYGKVLSIAE
jgi:glycosyltransferase involved in cell wall biosynthesis